MQEVVITAVSPGDTPEEELLGECRLEVCPEATDMGLLEAEGIGVHPVSTEGHPRVGVPEPEDLMAEVSEAVAAVAPDVSEAPRPKGRGRSAELTVLSIPKGFPVRCFL